MGDHERSHTEGPQAVQQVGLRVGIEACRRLVEHEQLRPPKGHAQQGAGDGNPAALAGRHALRVVAGQGLLAAPKRSLRSP